jgi:hypothetical protein
VVTAKNTVGSISVSSNTFTIIRPFDPSPPRNLQTVENISGQRTVTLSWDPPEDDGGSPIDGYSVAWNSNVTGASASGYYGASYGYTTTFLSGATRQLVIPVNDSTFYRYSVVASNTYNVSLPEIIVRATSPIPPLLSFTMTPSVVYLTEGESVTINITPKNVAIGTTLVWQVEPAASTFEENDWIQWLAGSRIEYTGQPLSITLTAKLDAKQEGTEKFTVCLYPEGGMPAVYRYLYASSTIYISEPLPKYEFRSGAPTSVNEGSSITFNVDTANVANGTTLYWEVVNITTNGNPDFSNTFGNFNISNNTGSFSVEAKADTSTEGAQEFYIILRRFGHGSGGGAPIAQSKNVTIIDTSTAPVTPAYQISRVGTSVNEGSPSNPFNIAGRDGYVIPNGTVLYWTIDTNAGDFAVSSGSVTCNNNLGQVSVTPTADLTTEGSETFTFSFRSGSVTGPILVSSISYIINDTSQATTVTPPPPPPPVPPPPVTPDGCVLEGRLLNGLAGPITNGVASVTGRATGGSVWGSPGAYTDDSDFGRAAVHAGILTVGQTGNIRFTNLGKRSSFSGSTANGITTNSWYLAHCAVSISAG